MGSFQLHDLCLIPVGVLDEIPKLMRLLHDLITDATHLAVESKTGLDVLCPHTQMSVCGAVCGQSNSVEELERWLENAES